MGDDNKFGVDGAVYRAWLQRTVQRSSEYRALFYRLLTLLVTAAMEKCHFRAALRILRLFASTLSDSFPFSLSVRIGVCLLWLRKPKNKNNDAESESEWRSHFERLVSAPQQTGFGGLYMLFADALIARRELKRAQILMRRIERIAVFDTARIWMRFADCYALQKQFDKAIERYQKVIDATKNSTDSSSSSSADEEVLFSARLKLTELHFLRNDEESALRLLREMKTMALYKTVETAQTRNENENENENGTDSDSDDDIENAENDDEKKKEQRVRLSSAFSSYFSAGLFGAVLVPKELLRLEVLHYELRANYAQSIELFNANRRRAFLAKCEGLVLELFLLCHSALRGRDRRFAVTFEQRTDSEASSSFGLSLSPRSAQLRKGAVTVSKFKFTNSGAVKVGVDAQIVCVNGEHCADFSFERITELLSAATLPATVEFLEAQNVFALLPQNRQSAQRRVYTVNHFAQILSDERVLEIVVRVLRIWFECGDDIDIDSDRDGDFEGGRARRQLSVLVSILEEASSFAALSFLWLAEAHLLFAFALFNDGAVEESYHSLVRALELAPANVDAIRHLYAVYARLKQHPKVERTLRRQLAKAQQRKAQNNGGDSNSKHSHIWHELILAHISFSKNSYDIAGNAYADLVLSAAESDGDGEGHSAFLQLMLGVTFLQHAMKRTVSRKRFEEALKGLAFVKRYVRLSQSKGTATQRIESAYNLARAFHLLGLFAMAQTLYEKVIRDIGRHCEGDSATMRLVPVLRYCAYNLAKIYLRAGQTALASDTLKRNIIV